MMGTGSLSLGEDHPVLPLPCCGELLLLGDDAWSLLFGELFEEEDEFGDEGSISDPCVGVGADPLVIWMLFEEEAEEDGILLEMGYDPVAVAADAVDPWFPKISLNSWDSTWWKRSKTQIIIINFMLLKRQKGRERSKRKTSSQINKRGWAIHTFIIQTNTLTSLAHCFQIYRCRTKERQECKKRENETPRSQIHELHCGRSLLSRNVLEPFFFRSVL